MNTNQTQTQDFAQFENDPNFQTAKQLLNRGFTVTNWGAQFTDTSEEIYVYKHGVEIAYFADGTSRSTERAFALVGLPDEDWADEVMHFLSDLTEAGVEPEPVEATIDLTSLSESEVVKAWLKDESPELFVQLVRQGYGLARFLDGYTRKAFSQSELQRYQERLAESVHSHSDVSLTWQKIEQIGRLLAGYQARHGLNFLQALVVLASEDQKDLNAFRGTKMEYLAETFGSRAYVVAEAIIWAVKQGLIVPVDPLKFLFSFTHARRGVMLSNGNALQLLREFVDSGKLPKLEAMDEQLLLDLHYAGIAGSYELGRRLVPLQTFVVGSSRDWWWSARQSLANRYAGVETEALVTKFQEEPNVVQKWAMWRQLDTRMVKQTPLSNEQTVTSARQLVCPEVSFELLREEMEKLRAQ